MDKETVRLIIAGQVLSGMLSNGALMSDLTRNKKPTKEGMTLRDVLCQNALEYADELIKQSENT